MARMGLVLFLLIWISACETTPVKKYSNLPEPLPLTEGQLVYEESGCVHCHGIQGDGEGFLSVGMVPRPTDFSNGNVMLLRSDSALTKAIRLGMPGTAMPSYRNFTDRQVRAVVGYLRSFAIVRE
ncbi:MAG: cytochrome c [Candidatus Nitrohelix vancouverensis]|uniref:Cytochrome c n=1 Tax=Candidatus Nitrohelix vancouverensis TaxID=2705534 RepID=A0A7T0G299_9BACT|nr:MAG: cytochrome c [Candidatus Nitrohelix vancouverensis]